MLNSTLRSDVRCAIMLAGGEGQRLRSLVQELLGDTLPKQYVNFIGTRSMLEHSFRRAEMLVPKERIFTVVSRDHLKYPRVQSQLAGRTHGTVVCQPANRDTAPGILLPLINVFKRYPGSTVAIFPSDHFILEERLFMRHVKLAFSVAEDDPSRVIMLGVHPSQPEAEYGYIVPDRELPLSWTEGVHKVKQFVEKPPLAIAEELIRKGGLWNTMVVVSKTKTLLDLFRKAIPDLYNAFEQILQAHGTPGEKAVVAEIYKDLRPANFSRELLEALPQKYPSSLSVLPVRGVYWSDLGLPRYVETALTKLGDRVGSENPTTASAELLSRISERSSLWKTA